MHRKMLQVYWVDQIKVTRQSNDVDMLMHTHSLRTPVTSQPVPVTHACSTATELPQSLSKPKDPAT